MGLGSLHEYPYFVSAAALSVVLLVGLLASGGRRRSALLAAAFGAPYALASPLFVPEYWAPRRIASLVTGPEDVLFSFANGGIVWLLATWPVRDRLRLGLGPRQMALRHAVSSTCGLVVILTLKAAGLGIMAASLTTMLVLGAVLLVFYHRWWRAPAAAAVGFGLIYFLVLRVTFALHPGFLQQWNGSNLWGPSLAGVPLEEVFWSIAYGAVYALLSFHVLGVTEGTVEDTAVRAELRLEGDG